MACTVKTIAAGAAGGTVAGLLLSGVFLGVERASDKPSVLIELGRKTAAKIGSPYRYNPSKPAPEEQLMSHGGHLALSAAMGATYPLIRPLPFMSGIPGSLLFGAAFYPLLWGMLGPVLKLTPTPAEEGTVMVAQRIGFHALFGLVTALVTNALAPERPSRA